MPSIEIDGKPCTFEGKKMILEVALENGIEIPHYCYHPGLSVVASCRICLAEVAAPDPRNDGKLSFIPKLLPTCQTPAADGQEVHTQSPKAIANQKSVMEYLLINHPLDCPVCDQAGECHLQDYSYRYGRGASRFEDQKIKNPTKDVGPHVKLYADRCIMCSRCVRFTREVSGTGELMVAGRGNREEIDVFPGRALDNELSGNVVDICPVGALLDKDFLFSQRVWFLKAAPTIDGLTASGDNLWAHHNEGRVYRLKPRTNLEVNRWWTSDEIRYGWKFVHDENRLAGPMRRLHGLWVPAEWPKACEAAVAVLREAREAGGHLGLLVSPMLASEEAYLLGRFIRALDEEARLAVGPVPVRGEEKTFPGGYTVRAEKAPNARGVRRALAQLGGEVLDFEAYVAEIAEKKSPVAASLVTGNYPSTWATDELVKGIGKKHGLVLLDTLPGPLVEKADVLLPASSWLEKGGCFENIDGRIQSFEPAITPLEGTRPEGQIALDLVAAAGEGPRAIYDPQAVRDAMGGPFVSEIVHPAPEETEAPDLEYVEL